MPETRAYETYAYDELNPEAKKRALQEIRADRKDVPAEMGGWMDQIRTDFEAMGFKDVWRKSEFGIHYALGHCQGDGVAFTGTADAVAFLAYFAETGDKDTYITEERRAKAKDLLGHIAAFWNESKKAGATFRVAWQGPYTHAHSMDVEWSTSFSDAWVNLGEAESDGVALLDKNVLAFIEDAVRSISRQKERDGYEEIEHQESDEFLGDFVNDHRYHEDGRIFREP